jgi:hypothetical protein
VGEECSSLSNSDHHDGACWQRIDRWRDLKITWLVVLSLQASAGSGWFNTLYNMRVYSGLHVWNVGLV